MCFFLRKDCLSAFFFFNTRHSLYIEQLSEIQCRLIWNVTKQHCIFLYHASSHNVKVKTLMSAFFTLGCCNVKASCISEGRPETWEMYLVGGKLLCNDTSLSPSSSVVISILLPGIPAGQALLTTSDHLLLKLPTSPTQLHISVSLRVPRPVMLDHFPVE